ncbi:hypothetical protein JOF53_006926 [Crossiella equi]|uniref:PPE family protein n=1 Tax=Crossiella equi TaxID=130796 RepID=A0ABS5AN99_9PSEU|nr:hypothetical protein [Crossiella equi]MBP2478054.1 hypothetical protein [Crossiella equi]
MSQGPSIRYNRFEGVELAQKYAWVQNGPGSGAVEGTTQVLREAHELVAQAHQRVVGFLARLGLSWEGAAAEAMIQAGDEAVRWAEGSLEVTAASLERIAVHGVDFAETKPRIAPPEPVVDLKQIAVGVFSPLVLVALGEDPLSRLADNKAKDDAANRALYAYEQSARAGIEPLPALPDPPAIALDVVGVVPPRQPREPRLPGGGDPGLVRPGVDPDRERGTGPGQPGVTQPGGTQPGRETTEVAGAVPGGATPGGPGTVPSGSPGAMVPEAGGRSGGASGWLGGGFGPGAGGLGAGGVVGLGGAGGAGGYRGNGAGASPHTPVPRAPAPRTPAPPGGGAGVPGGKAGVPGMPGPVPTPPGGRAEDDLEHTSRFRKLSDEIYGLDDLPSVPPPVIGEGES